MTAKVLRGVAPKGGRLCVFGVTTANPNAWSVSALHGIADTLYPGVLTRFRTGNRFPLFPKALGFR